MTYTQKDGQGSLFINKDKDTEQQPNMTGTLTLGGKQYRVAAWTKVTKGGDKWLSLNVQPKQERPPASSGDIGRKAAAEESPFSDDIPF